MCDRFKYKPPENHHTVGGYNPISEEITKKKMMESPQRIERALEYAIKYGGIDGGHHKMWVIDQMIRALTGCVENKGTQGESEEYLKLVREARSGVDGPNTYDWDVGVAP
jgi:hypothetical protein